MNGCVWDDESDLFWKHGKGPTKQAEITGNECLTTKCNHWLNLVKCSLMSTQADSVVSAINLFGIDADFVHNPVAQHNRTQQQAELDARYNTAWNKCKVEVTKHLMKEGFEEFENDKSGLLFYPKGVGKQKFKEGMKLYNAEMDIRHQMLQNIEKGIFEKTFLSFMRNRCVREYLQ